MAHTFEYAILTAIPDPRRGERVNIGLVVFRLDRLDVRFKHASPKLRALTGDAWEISLEAAENRLAGLFLPEKDRKQVLAEFALLEPLLKPSSLSSFSVRDEEDYERKIGEIIATLIVPPKRNPVEQSKSRINTEITAEFKQANILASKGGGLDTGQVVRDFPIAPQEGLTADYALKNGKLHVTSTLDLRKASASLGDAALKSIVLDKAEDIYGDSVRKIGVYAVEEEARSNFTQHIELLGDYSDDLYNWSDPQDQWKFKKSLFDAIRSRFSDFQLGDGEGDLS